MVQFPPFGASAPTVILCQLLLHWELSLAKVEHQAWDFTGSSQLWKALSRLEFDLFYSTQQKWILLIPDSSSMHFTTRSHQKLSRNFQQDPCISHAFMGKDIFNPYFLQCVLIQKFIRTKQHLKNFRKKAFTLRQWWQIWNKPWPLLPSQTAVAGSCLLQAKPTAACQLQPHSRFYPQPLLWVLQRKSIFVQPSKECKLFSCFQSKII